MQRSNGRTLPQAAGSRIPGRPLGRYLDHTSIAVEKFEVIILANSYKRRGRCIAGVRADNGQWVRLISGETGHGELYPDHYLYDDGGEPEMLDVVRVGCTEPRPKPYHPEDWLIGECFWELVSRPISPELIPVLRSAVQRGGLILGDRTPKLAMSELTDNPAGASLTLVSPTEFRWKIVSTPENAHKPRIVFKHGGERYDLPITDPLWVERLRELTVGTHAPDAAGLERNQRVLLTISLSEEFEDHFCYKLAAAVKPVDPVWSQQQ